MRVKHWPGLVPPAKPRHSKRICRTYGLYITPQAQPTTWQLYRSIAFTKNSQPSSAQMRVISLIHTRFGASGVKFLRSKFSVIGHRSSVIGHR